MTSADSHNWRHMPVSEQDVDSGIGVPVMLGAAVATRPCSYSKVRDTFRPRRRETPARRTHLGGKRLVHFLVPSPVPNGFIAEHVAERRPACIQNGFRHLRLREILGVRVAYGNKVELSNEPGRQFVQIVAAPVGYFGRDRIWIIAHAAGVRRDQGKRTAKEWGRLLWPRALGGPSPWASATNNDEIRSCYPSCYWDSRPCGRA